ncbi:MAG: hydroxyacid dehydrogenase [Bacteroidetes bacterium]|nr:hydroxyacid dehydrogenase [Bacteroidota bacterium]
MKPRLLVITPVKHIQGVCVKLETIADVTYINDPSIDEVLSIIFEYDALYTNPNKTKIYIGKDLIDAGKKLKVVCTASTGTNHIDMDYAKMKGISVLSLTEERDIINKISSTAEHAFALTMTSLRNVITSNEDVLSGNWDYEKFIGRQMDGLTIGVVGYGRLGSLYSKYCLAFGSKVKVYDPYKKINNNKIKLVNNIDELLSESDIISFHVHVSEETKNMVNINWFNKMKKDVLLVNTSRGDIIVEKDLVNFLSANKKATIATDVLADEIRNRTESPLFKYALNSDRVTITPHIGGMTKEAQEIAYNHAALILSKHFSKLS